MTVQLLTAAIVRQGNCQHEMVVEVVAQGPTAKAADVAKALRNNLCAQRASDPRTASARQNSKVDPVLTLASPKPCGRSKVQALRNVVPGVIGGSPWRLNRRVLDRDVSATVRACEHQFAGTCPPNVRSPENTRPFWAGVNGGAVLKWLHPRFTIVAAELAQPISARAICQPWAKEALPRAGWTSWRA